MRKAQRHREVHIHPYTQFNIKIHRPTRTHTFIYRTPSTRSRVRTQSDCHVCTLTSTELHIEMHRGTELLMHTIDAHLNKKTSDTHAKEKIRVRESK